MRIGGTDIVQAMSDAGYLFTIEGISGRDPVEAEQQTAARPGSDGVRLIAETLPDREVKVDYSLVADDEQSRRDAGRLLGRLIGRGVQRVEFSDQDGHYNGTTRNVEGEQWPRFGRGELITFCPQPFLYGDEVTVSPSNGTVSIDSNHYVEPVILWTTSSAVGAAWIEVDGHRLTIDTGISSGQQIRIDCARKETRVGGVLNVENIHGVYPRVYDGSTVETSPGGSLEMTYRERWI